MSIDQKGIFVEGSSHHHWLEYEIDQDVPADGIRSAIGTACSPHPDGEITSNTDLVVAFGEPLWRRLAPQRTPVGLRSFEMIQGADGHVAPSTQRSLWFWTHGQRIDLTFARAMHVHHAIGELATLSLEETGFTYRDSRDLTGFIDGTANPKDEARQEAALIPAGQVGAGGSFVLTQRWIHNLPAFHALDDAEQQRVIGRTKPDSVELEGDAMPPNSHVSRTDLKQDGVGVKIYRRSAPFGGVAEHGLYFLAFACDLARFDLLLRSMFGATGDGVHDRLIEFSRPDSGSYYFAPSQKDLDDAIRGASP